MFARIMSASVIGLALTAGCSSFGGGPGPGSAEGARLAAMAATANYPTKAATDDIKLGVLVEDESLQLLNFSSTRFAGARLWVNGSFVADVPAIPARGTISVRKNEFFDRAGNNLFKTKADVTKVQMESGDVFATLQGPISETN